MNIIQKAKEKALNGVILTENEIIELLEISLGSKEDQELREKQQIIMMIAKEFLILIQK